MSEFWAWNPFSVGIKRNKQALGNTKKVLTEAKALYDQSPLPDYDHISFTADIIRGALDGEDVFPSENILMAFMNMFEDIYYDEALIPLDESVVLDIRPNSREALGAREYLRRQIRFLQNYDSNMADAQQYLVKITRYLMTEIPIHALTGNTDDGFLSLSYSDLLPNLAETVEALIRSVFDDDLRYSNLFDPLRDRLESNIMRVSKIDPHMPPANLYRYIMPEEAAAKNNGLSDDQIIDEYLIGTPYRNLFRTELPLAINEEARFEHSHILGGTGHGKTQFIQKWIIKDLEHAIAEKRSVVVIDSQGDLISKIARLDVFNPEYGDLKNKLIIIDPTDVMFPAAINMFAMDEERLASYGPVEREKVQNSAIALYEHFFGELLGAELTAKQGVVFKYLARLMLEIPNATILTLRDLMDDPRPFIPYMDKLTGSARVFFAREFLDRSFNQTKKQISKRLWGVLSNPAFERLFSSKENKIDLFSKMNEGSIILINTAKDLLKQDGAALYGRFFLSMIGQAIMERAVIPEHDRIPTFLYVDECQDYFDETIEVLLAQGRKYKIGLTLAHQHFDQLTTSQRASVLANTSIKACGGVNAKDARLLAQEMRVSADYLQSMRKTKWDTEFALSIKHDLPTAIKVSLPFGYLENFSQMDDQYFMELLKQNRDQYCWEYVAEDTKIEFPYHGKKQQKVERPSPVVEPVIQVQATSEQPQIISVEAPATSPKEIGGELTPELLQSGKGGKRHTYLQNLIQNLAQDQGWRSEIEYPVLDGAGQIDVALLRGENFIACEISITTPAKHEIQNIQKCLNAGADEIWIVAEKRSKLTSIETLAQEFSDADISKLCFLMPDDIPAELDARSVVEQSEGSLVRGYKVKINKSVGTKREAEDRRSRIIAALASGSK